jgi:membrane protein
MNILRPLGRVNPFEYIKQLFKLIFRDRVPAKATGLAYTTILAMVPLMTMLISFGSRELVEGPVKDLITTTMLPTSQDFIFSHLTSFAENSRNLGKWGLSITIFVVFLLINKIEIEVDALLRARPNKNILTRLAIYFLTIIIGTLTISSSFSLTNDIVNLISWDLIKRFSPIQKFYSSIASIILIGITILMLIMLVSSACIKWRSALTGAVAGAFFWELAKKIFSLWASYSIRNSVIYGSLFLIPILFIWVNLAWIIILTSLEIAYLHQHPDYILFLEEKRQAPSLQAVMTLEIYLAIKDKFLDGEKAPQLEQLTFLTGLPEIEVLLLLDRLLRYNLILKTDQKGYVPSSDPDRVTKEEMINAALDDESAHRCLSESKAKKLWMDFMESRTF